MHQAPHRKPAICWLGRITTALTALAVVVSADPATGGDASTILEQAERERLRWRADVMDLTFERVDGAEERTVWPSHLLQPFGWREPIRTLHQAEEPWSLYLLEFPAHQEAWLWFGNGQPVLTHGQHYQREGTNATYRLVLRRPGDGRLEGFMLCDDVVDEEPARLIALLREAMRRDLSVPQVDLILGRIGQLLQREIVDPQWAPWLATVASGQLQTWALKRRVVPVTQTGDGHDHHFYSVQRLAGDDPSRFDARARAAALAYRLDEDRYASLLVSLADTPESALAAVTAMQELRQLRPAPLPPGMIAKLAEMLVRDYPADVEVNGKTLYDFLRDLLHAASSADPEAGVLLALHMLGGPDLAFQHAAEWVKVRERRPELLHADPDTAAAIVEAMDDPQVRWSACWLLLQHVAPERAFHIMLDLHLAQRASGDRSGADPRSHFYAVLPMHMAGSHLLLRALQLGDRTAYQRLIDARVELPDHAVKLLPLVIGAAELGGVEPFDQLVALGGSAGMPLPQVLRDRGNISPLVAATGNRAVLERMRDDWGHDILQEPVIRSALQAGQVDLARWLIEQGAELPPARSERLNVLHIAASNGHVNTLRFLLGQGWPLEEGPVWTVSMPDPRGGRRQVRTDRRQTALYNALDARQYEAARFLLSQGADIRHVERLYYERPTQPHLPEKDPEKLLRFLIEHGADPDGVQHANGTALFNAVTYGEVWRVRLLLEAGADPNIPNPDGMTPREWIQAHRRPATGPDAEILALLRDHAGEEQ